MGGAEDGDGGRAGGGAFDGEGGGIVAVGHDPGGVEDEVWRGETAAPDAAGDGYDGDGSCRHYGYRDRGGACAMGHAAMSIQRVWAVQVGFHLGHWGKSLAAGGRLVRSFFCRAMPISDKPFTIMDSAIIPKISDQVSGYRREGLV